MTWGDIALPARIVGFGALIGVGAYIGGAAGAILAIIVFTAAELLEARTRHRDARLIEGLEAELREATRPESARERSQRLEDDMRRMASIRHSQTGGRDSII